MADVMVTGRMSEEKKADATRILRRDGLTASQAINLLFDKVVEDQSASFLVQGSRQADAASWQAAAAFIDSIPQERKTRFDSMTKQQAKMERLADRGLL